MFEYIKLIVENLWQIAGLVFVIWVVRNPDILKMINTVKLGDLEITMKALQEEVEMLGEELEREGELFNDILQSFDANAPVEELQQTNELLRARAHALENLEEIKALIAEDATDGQLYAGAIVLRERKPIQLLEDLIACLNRLATDDNLRGIRLKTVWRLTSALHKIVMNAVKAGHSFDAAVLKQAAEMLDTLEQNPRVQGDKPEEPTKGVRGPIKYARSWIGKAVQR